MLDAVSLAASGHSAAAQATMSPALKQAVPKGGFRPKVTEPKDLSQNAKKRLQDLSVMTRSQSFQNASEKFGSASTRLESEAQKQSKYWEQMASLRSKGWQISRLPHDNRSVVVHFGAADSSQQYRDKGMAYIRQDENGDLFIPGQAEMQTQKVLCVRVHRGFKTTGSFTYRQEPIEGHVKLHQDLLLAREALFMEELFTEASKEARLIANIGVQARSSSITFDLSEDCSVEVAYSSVRSGKSTQRHADDELASMVGNTLRLMLVAEHQQRHVQRSQQAPPPMSQTLRPPPEYVLLRPIINQLRHHQMITPVLDVLKIYKSSLEQAGLHLTYTTECISNQASTHLTLEALKELITTEIKLKLPSETLLSVKVRTHLSPPMFGTQFSTSGYSSECGSCALSPTSSITAMLQTLNDILSRDISCVVLGFIRRTKNQASWHGGDVYPIQLVHEESNVPQLSFVIGCREGKLAVGSLKEGVDSAPRVQWAGELSATQQEARSLLDTIGTWITESSSS